MEIKLEVQDKIINELGILHIQDYLQQKLDQYQLKVSASKISQKMNEVEVDWEKEFEKDKQEAWEEYKSNLNL